MNEVIFADMLSLTKGVVYYMKVSYFIKSRLLISAFLL
jgi:hypothetical protein